MRAFVSSRPAAGIREDGAVTDSLIYESPRVFEVWRWGPGHSGLLLRSNPTDLAPTRIEVWFKPADAACLPSSFTGLHIAPATAALHRQVRETLGRDLQTRDTLYAVQAGQTQGWVLGGSVNGAEDDRSSYEPAIFRYMPTEPKLPRRDLFSTYTAGH